jgi:glycosyltransferase involved in cell wall biosynthesis
MKMMQMGRAWKLRQSHMVDKFNHFIYVSDFSRKILEPYIPKSTGQTTLYNPAGDEQEPIATPEHSDIFSFVGRLSPEKGGVLFAEAAKKAGVNCQFIGKGPEEAKIRAVNPEAIFTGWISASEVEAKIRESRAVVMPSLWYETAGLSVIEAVSRGIPVVVSDKCASVEYMRHDRSGLTFSSGEVESFAKALKAMTAIKSRQMGINAYQDYWQNPLTTEKYMSGLLDVYSRTAEI